MVYNKSLNSLVVNSYDNKITFFKVQTNESLTKPKVTNLSHWKMLCGNNDEILSAVIVKYSHKQSEENEASSKRKRDTPPDQGMALFLICRNRFNFLFIGICFIFLKSLGIFYFYVFKMH